MNGIFAKWPDAMSREGRSGMIPPGPSMTGGNRNPENVLSATVHAEMTSSMLAFCAQSTDVPAATVPAHPGRFATNKSHTGSRCEALKKGRVPAEPDSMINELSETASEHPSE